MSSLVALGLAFTGPHNFVHQLGSIAVVVVTAYAVTTWVRAYRVDRVPSRGPIDESDDWYRGMP